jgi:orotate phosphoribosyltransferase
MDTKRLVARALLDIGAVGFCLDKPITFKSGIKSPVYVDNRIFPFFPLAWRTVIRGFKDLIETNEIPFDVLAGIETAGIPHCSALGYLLKRPSVFCRKHAKEHGTKKMIEGGEVSQKRVVLVEDLVTTGGSSLAGVAALRDSGAAVTDCLVIVSYGFEEAEKSFKDANVSLHALTTFPVILEQALQLRRIDAVQQQVVLEWIDDPWNWRA